MKEFFKICGVALIIWTILRNIIYLILLLVLKNKS